MPKPRNRAGKCTVKDEGAVARAMWTPLEDEVLMIFVKNMRPGDYYGNSDASTPSKPPAWDRVADEFNREFRTWKQQFHQVDLAITERDGKSCRSRWKYHVSLARTKRGTKTPMSPEEDEYIIYMQNKISNKWSLISAQMSRRFGIFRTDNDVKNRWNSKLNKVVESRRQKGIPLPSVEPGPPADVPIPSPNAKQGKGVPVRSPSPLRPQVDSRLLSITSTRSPWIGGCWSSATSICQLQEIPEEILTRLWKLHGVTPSLVPSALSNLTRKPLRPVLSDSHQNSPGSKFSDAVLSEDGVKWASRKRSHANMDCPNDNTPRVQCVAASTSGSGLASRESDGSTSHQSFLGTLPCLSGLLTGFSGSEGGNDDSATFPPASPKSHILQDIRDAQIHWLLRERLQAAGSPAPKQPAATAAHLASLTGASSSPRGSPSFGVGTPSSLRNSSRPDGAPSLAASAPNQQLDVYGLLSSVDTVLADMWQQHNHARRSTAVSQAPDTSMSPLSCSAPQLEPELDPLLSVNLDSFWS